jgi:hypothetical protein
MEKRWWLRSPRCTSRSIDSEGQSFTLEKYRDRKMESVKRRKEVGRGEPSEQIARPKSIEVELPPEYRARASRSEPYGIVDLLADTLNQWLMVAHSCQQSTLSQGP